ncbi:hypothetical protein phiGrn1_0281 [Vibrio phage phi-Grn1]|uniref:Uncharacterized protein n=1 Tax=Vibrio phage phi-Grn1 TaxID=1747713 RepID=A0A140B3J6_9CAUD|nr:hypothetical protein phiGrn1_0281 [Vibrio phage phi-Grn1]
MKELLKTMTETEEAIAAKFGLDHLWHGLVDCTDVLFTCDLVTDDVKDMHTVIDQIREFQYGFEDANALEEGECYAVEVYGTSVWLSTDGKYMLTVANDGRARDFYIFDMNNLRSYELY